MQGGCTGTYEPSPCPGKGCDLPWIRSPVQPQHPLTPPLTACGHCSHAPSLSVCSPGSASLHTQAPMLAPSSWYCLLCPAAPRFECPLPRQPCLWSSGDTCMLWGSGRTCLFISRYNSVMKRVPSRGRRANQMGTESQAAAPSRRAPPAPSQPPLCCRDRAGFQVDRPAVHIVSPIHWAAGLRDKGRLCLVAVGQPEDPGTQSSSRHQVPGEGQWGPLSPPDETQPWERMPTAGALSRVHLNKEGLPKHVSTGPSEGMPLGVQGAGQGLPVTVCCT